jgi:hypothetical protein
MGRKSWEKKSEGDRQERRSTVVGRGKNRLLDSNSTRSGKGDAREQATGLRRPDTGFHSRD